MTAKLRTEVSAKTAYGFSLSRFVLGHAVVRQQVIKPFTLLVSRIDMSVSASITGEVKSKVLQEVLLA